MWFEKYFRVLCINTESMTIFERSAKILGSNRLTMDTNLYAKPRMKNTLKTAKMSRRSNWQSQLLTCTLICLISSLTQGLSGIQAATFTRQTELESSTYVYEGKTNYVIIYDRSLSQPDLLYIKRIFFKIILSHKGVIIVWYFHYNFTKIENSKTFLFALIFWWMRKYYDKFSLCKYFFVTVPSTKKMFLNYYAETFHEFFVCRMRAWNERKGEDE